MGTTKATIAGVSMMIVVAIVIALIFGNANKPPCDGHDQDDDDDDHILSTSSKSAAAVCKTTDFKQICVESLGPLAHNTTASPELLLQTAINTTIQYVRLALTKSSNLGNSSEDPHHKMSMEDCQDLLQFAVAELQASYAMIEDDDKNHTVEDKVAELMNWLSAVVSYQQTCLDGIQDPNLKNQMSNGLMNATELTSNALAIVSAMSSISTSFNSRKLLEQERDNGEYPEWISGPDRKLLATRGGGDLQPDAVVAKDGSGKFKTIAAALAAYPKNHKGRYVIYVKAGIYDEYITVEKDQTNVLMYGDGSRKTIVTGRKSFRDGFSTFKTASFSAIGKGFIAKSMGFQNTAGPEGHQAVALRVQSDMSAFYNCRMDGYQDTLYVQTHRQFYRNCVISGTVDFIFGDAATVIQNCLIIVRKPGPGQKNAVTAQGRADKRETTGIVIQNCRIVPEKKLFPVRFQYPTFLGRPWKQFSRTVIMESTIGDLIQPAGWMEWEGSFALDTLYYGEYANRGPGAVTSRRVGWKGYKDIRNRNEALMFTSGPFLQGNLWLRYTGAPHFLGLRS